MSCKVFLLRRGAYRALALLCVLCLLLLTAAYGAPLRVGATSLSDLENQYDALKRQAADLEATIQAQEKDLSDKQAYQKSIEAKMQNARDQISLLNSQISAQETAVAQLNEQIAAKEAEITGRQADLDAQSEALRVRLRAISKTGNTSLVQMLLDTESYTDYLIKSKIMERVSENDQRLMDELDAQIQQLNDDKAALDTDKADASARLADIEQKKKEADAQKTELDGLYAKAAAATKDVNSALANYQNTLKSTKADMDALDRQITEFIRQQTQKPDNGGGASSGNYGGGTMFWPVPAVRNISSGFGYRWGTLHRGIDIANGSVPVYGKEVVAAADGVVIYTNKSGWGGGYGLYLIIDHGRDANGNNITTLYAHNSQVNVSVGDRVVGGQTVVSHAGDTGDVTGPHLHFEVRVNGTAVDPIKNGYVSYK